MKYRRSRALAAAVALATVASIGLARATPTPPPIPPGCHPERLAVAHHANGLAVQPQPKKGPVACSMYTGYAGQEGKIEVTATGALMFQPVSAPTDPTGTGAVPGDTSPGGQSMFSDGGIGVSHDNGGHWQFVKPAGLTWLNDDEDAYVDRSTGRFFASYIGADPPTQVPTGAPTAYNVTQSQIVMSPDDGATWFASQACCEISDEATFTAGPPPTGQPKPTGYPNVVYFCWQASQDVPPQPPSRVCSRSLDGGKSWQLAGFMSRGVVPVHTDVCPTPGSMPPSTSFTGGTSPDDEVAGMPQAAPDGSLYAVLSCGGKAYLIRSTDEAATWPLVYPPSQQLPHTGELRVDTAGNLYLMRATMPAGDLAGDGNGAYTKLLLSVSTDKGRTWSPEINVLAPGLAWFEASHTALDPPGWSCCTQWFYDVREPGHVAVVYNGGTTLPDKDGNAVVNGYITETRNALARDPLLWSAMVNDPGTPLKYGPGFPRGTGIFPTGPDGPGADQGSAQTNALGLNIGPDGSPWAAFVEDCGPTPQAPRCREQHNQTRGVAARLAWPR